MIKKLHKLSEHGQIIILVAFAFVGLIGMVGLMIDGGILLIDYARLKRGIDAASIAAAAQFRKNFVEADLIAAGEELLRYNQADAVVEIFTCDYPNTLHDTSLCPGPGEAKRKLVRVTATRTVNFGFLRVIGWNTTDITATSVGEAASIDMVLVIDNSASMAWETTGNVLDPNYATNCPGTDCVDPNKSDLPSPGHIYGDNPYECNLHYVNTPSLRCEPFGTIKDVASQFVDQLFFPYDRVAVVTLTQSSLGGTRETTSVLPFNDNFNDITNLPTTEIQTSIDTLMVIQPALCPATGPCVYFNPTPASLADAVANPQNYDGQGCTDFNDTTTPPKNPSSCGSSNIGGGLNQAAREFEVEPVRKDSFWAVIALFGGPANATNTVTGLPFGLCPESTWPPTNVNGFCRDRDPEPYTLGTATRHAQNPDLSYPANYDADDFARDAADFLTSPTTGKGVTLFSICVGGFCQGYPSSTDRASAEHLGQYMALNAGDSAGPPVVLANHGLYFLATDATQLAPIFNAIAANIFTRISQ